MSVVVSIFLGVPRFLPSVAARSAVRSLSMTVQFFVLTSPTESPEGPELGSDPPKCTSSTGTKNASREGGVLIEG